MSEQEQPKFFSVAEISRILGISRSKVYELICADNYPFTAAKIGKRICIPANSFLNGMRVWLEMKMRKCNSESKIILLPNC